MVEFSIVVDGCMKIASLESTVFPTGFFDCMPLAVERFIAELVDFSSSPPGTALSQLSVIVYSPSPQDALIGWFGVKWVSLRKISEISV